MRTRSKVIAGASVAGVVLLALLVWFFIFRSTADKKLDASDLDKAVASTTIAADPPTSAAGAVPATTDPATAATTGAADGVDGTWTATTDGSTLGYRVKEVLAGVDKDATGRTDQVTGSLTISGTQVTAATFSVDVASITSDDSRRDGQFRGRIMNVGEFPTAAFTLTQPIELGSVPEAGATTTVSATGDLTLHGQTRSVTFDVQAKMDNGRIGVLGNIPVTFSDYGIDNPSTAIAKVGNDGLLEFVIAFTKA